MSGSQPCKHAWLAGREVVLVVSASVRYGISLKLHVRITEARGRGRGREPPHNECRTPGKRDGLVRPDPGPTRRRGPRAGRRPCESAGARRGVDPGLCPGYAHYLLK